MAVTSLKQLPSFGDSCLDVSFASRPRPPIPGKEDDQMPSDCCDPCTRLDILGDSGGGGDCGIADERLQAKSNALHHHFSKRTAIENCPVVKHDTNTKLETCRTGSAVGYEPNGSAAAASSSSCLKWAEGLDNLLHDSDGVRLFKEFLNQEQDLNSVDFWFACSGLKMMGAADSEKIIGLAKLIYKKYVRGDALRLKSDAKRRIVDRMKKGLVDQTIFDEAQAEIELSMRSDLYPQFLKSDLYLQYVQTGQESPKQSNNSSGSEPLYQAGGIGNLPTLHEDEELASKDLEHTSVSSMSLTSSSLLATRKSREGFPTRFYGCAYPSGPSSRLSNPYHVSYAPVSAQDSELQSLSSDAQTDDAMSHTEGSLDGRGEHPGYKNKNLFRKQIKAMRRCAEVNQEADVHFIQQFVPRTERVPIDSNLAEIDPDRFAGRLIERLLEVKEESDKMECVKKSLQSIQDVDLDESVSSAQARRAGYNPHNNSCDASRNFSFASMLLASTVGNSDVEDNAQSILDDHVSHVWNSSGTTPSRSPGFQTPSCPRRDPTRPAAAAPRTRDCPGGSFVPAAVTHGRTNHKDARFLGCDVTPVQPVHRHAPRHHHHHHHPQPKEMNAWPHLMSESNLQFAQRSSLSPMLGRSTTSWTNAVDAATKMANARKGCDTNNRYVDPGDERVTSQVTDYGQNDLQRVLMWVLDSEKYCGDGAKNRCSTDGSDKGSLSHKRSSHKSINGGSKKNASHKSLRSESLDRNGFTPDLPLNCLSSSGQIRPVVQDGFLIPSALCVPGGLSDEAKTRHVHDGRPLQMKSRGELYPEPVLRPQSNSIPFQNLSTNRGIPQPSGAVLSQSSSDEQLSISQRSDVRLFGANNSSKDSVTVVGCYFCDEPIPYRMTLPGSSVTLGQFKQLISKKGNYRYFFKKACTEFESGVVHEEITCDSDILPLWEGKVVCKVERIH